MTWARAQLRSAGALLRADGLRRLTGCVAARRTAGRRGALFKAQVGDISGGVSPGPHSVWYVRRQPVAYVKMGFATWQPERTHGLRAWIARHFGHRAPSGAGAEVKAIARGEPGPAGALAGAGHQCRRRPGDHRARG